MNPTLDPEQVSERVISTLEQMFFLFADPVDEPGDELGSHIGLRLDHEGGILRLLVSGDDVFLGELAASLLGMDADELDVQEDGVAALSELANVLGGEVSRLMGGEEQRVRSGLPEPAEVPTDSPALSCTFDAEGGLFRLSVYPQSA